MEAMEITRIREFKRAAGKPLLLDLLLAVVLSWAVLRKAALDDTVATSDALVAAVAFLAGPPRPDQAVTARRTAGGGGGGRFGGGAAGPVAAGGGARRGGGGQGGRGRRGGGHPWFAGGARRLPVLDRRAPKPPQGLGLRAHRVRAGLSDRRGGGRRH